MDAQMNTGKKKQKKKKSGSNGQQKSQFPEDWQAGELARRSEEEYRLLFESIDEGFCTIEVLFDDKGKPLDYRFLEVNPAFERHTGIKNAVGKKMREIAPFHEDHWFEAYGKVALTGEPVRFENFAEKLGRWFDVYAFRVDKPEDQKVAIIFSDITDRKMAEKERERLIAEIEAERQRKSEILESIGDVFYALDEDFNFTYLNHKTEKVWKRKREDLLGKNFWKEFPEVIGSKSERMHLKAAEEKTPVHYEAVSAILNKWISVSIFPRENGGLSVYFRDIQRQKLFEENLRESEERLRLATQAAEMGTWDWNLVSDQVIWDKQFCRLLGVSEDQKARPIDEFFRQIHPDDREKVYWLLQRSIAEKDIFEAEYRLLRKDDSLRWMSSYGKVVEEKEGDPVRMIGILLDITDRRMSEEAIRRSEAHLRLILESAEDHAIITLDLKGIITRWNSGAENLFGYAPEEAIGRSVDLIFTPEDCREGVPAKEMEGALKNGRAEDERWHLHKDGKRFYVSGVMTLLSNGKPEGFVKIARDLTEQRRLNEEVRFSRDQLDLRVKERTRELAEAYKTLKFENEQRRQAEKDRITLLEQLVTTQEDERRRIARDMHDQFGQQLTALRLKLELLKEMCQEDEGLCEQVDQTQAVAKQLDRDVSFLVWELRPTPLDNLGLREALINYVRQWSEHFEIPAEVHIGAFEADDLVSSQAEISLYRIAQEALNNVYKHAGATHVSVILEQLDGFLTLIIEDNGVGFEPEPKNNRTDGLGLIGMRERAALIGGRLEIESGSGKGTTIFLRLPVKYKRRKKSKKKNSEKGIN